MKTLNSHAGVILPMNFPGNIIFCEVQLFKMYSISLSTIKGKLYFKLALTSCYPKPLNVYKCQWSPTKKDVFLCSICDFFVS